MLITGGTKQGAYSVRVYGHSALTTQFFCKPQMAQKVIF